MADESASAGYKHLCFLHCCHLFLAGHG
jgi:hypothetical protein